MILPTVQQPQKCDELHAHNGRIAVVIDYYPSNETQFL